MSKEGEPENWINLFRFEYIFVNINSGAYLIFILGGVDEEGSSLFPAFVKIENNCTFEKINSWNLRKGFWRSGS